MTPTRGPLGAAVVPLDRNAADLSGGRPRLVYADLDLAGRPALRHALGLPEAGDDALLCAAYARWGPGAADRLTGAFAFALWDPARRAVVAARDPLGLRPLVYAVDRGRLVIGGDVRAVRAAGGLSDALDPDLLASALLDGHFDPGPLGRTFLRAVDELPGGHHLTVDGRGARVERYWRPEEIPVQPFRSVGEAAEAMRAALRAAVADAVAGVPAGALGGHLTAGIDAATVLAFAAADRSERGHPPPHALTWLPAPGAAPLPEHERMMSLVQRWGLPLTHVPPDPDALLTASLLDATRDPVTQWGLEEPTRRAAAAAGVRVVLSGWGGDEAASFSGRALATAHLLRTGRWGPVAAMVAREPLEAVRRARSWRRRRSGALGGPSLEALRAAALRGERETFVRPEVLRAAALPERPEAPREPRAYARWLLSWGHLGRRAEAWARAGTAHGIRYRYPLLDRRVLEVALGVPEALWLARGGRRRWVFRDAGAGLVPDALRLGGKAEPGHAAALAQATRGIGRQVAPLVTEAAAGERAAIVDVARLRAAWEAVATNGLADDLPTRVAQTRGLHATQFLALGDAHGLLQR